MKHRRVLTFLLTLCMVLSLTTFTAAENMMDAIPDVETVTDAEAIPESIAEEAGTIAEAMPEVIPEERTVEPGRTADVVQETAVLMADGVTYLDFNADGTSNGEQTCTDYTLVTSGSTAWSAGWYVVDSDVTIASRITVTGDVHLILVDGKTLTASKGITTVTGDNKLTIYAQSTAETTMGKLSATGGEYGAGIGGGWEDTGGTITINGGTVTARAARLPSTAARSRRTAARAARESAAANPPGAVISLSVEVQ